MKRTLGKWGTFVLLSLAGYGMAQSTDDKSPVQANATSNPQVRTVATLGGSPKQCAFAVQPLIQELRSTPYPPDWNFLVVCTDTEWSRVLRMADIRATDTAFTVLPKRTTVIRAAIFIENIQRGYKHTLWHELGHVQCNCMNEDKANKYAHDNEK